MFLFHWRFNSIVQFLFDSIACALISQPDKARFIHSLTVSFPGKPRICALISIDLSKCAVHTSPLWKPIFLLPLNLNAARPFGKPFCLRPRWKPYYQHSNLPILSCSTSQRSALIFDWLDFTVFLNATHLLTVRIRARVWFSFMIEDVKIVLQCIIILRRLAQTAKLAG